MEDLLKQMEEHLRKLNIGYEQQIANLHAQEGAMQELKKWIETIKNSKT